MRRSPLSVPESRVGRGGDRITRVCRLAIILNVCGVYVGFSSLRYTVLYIHPVRTPMGVRGTGYSDAGRALSRTPLFSLARGGTLGVLLPRPLEPMICDGDSGVCTCASRSLERLARGAVAGAVAGAREPSRRPRSIALDGHPLRLSRLPQLSQRAVNEAPRAPPVHLALRVLDREGCGDLCIRLWRLAAQPVA